MSTISFGDANSGFQVGVNHGAIYLSKERQEPRPEPLSTVPYPPDPDFVSRDVLLDEIHEKASIPGSRTVLIGLGGVGKTQLAIEYSHRLRRQSPETSVFWIHASNATRCENSLRDLADRVRIPGRQDRNANIFSLVASWLQDQRIGQWILILDNVDDDELLRKPLSIAQASQANDQRNYSMQPPLRYLLESSNGSILVTSRNRGVALDIAGHSNIVEVQPMKEAEAVDLLQKKLNTPAEQEERTQLGKELEFMPLAIIQAASYITHRSPRCSVSQYLEKIRKSDREAARLLDYEAGLLYRDWEAKNSILLTWQISFDHIKSTRPSAASLLSLMSFLDRQGIPENILRGQHCQETGTHLCLDNSEDSSGEEDGDGGSDADQRFEDDITTLSDYSLISVGEQRTSFTMHRLVQLTVRTWLKTHGQLEAFKEKFINSLYCEFPTGEYENWEKCRSLFPHVTSAVSQRPKSQASLQQWATLLYRGAWYARESGKISESREMASRSREQRLKIFGTENTETLDSDAMLAIAYRLEGRWKEAEHLEVQVMETRKTKLGADHPNTLTSMRNLALTYTDQGRWEEATQLQVQVIETSKTKLGAEDHPDTLTTMANLASTYMSQGRWEEAKQLNVQVIEIRKAKLGVDHPDTLTSMANLASTYMYQGQWEEAEQLNVQVIEIRKAKLGVDHPDTLTSMANLASTYMNQGRLEEAKQLSVQVIETRKAKLGADHPNTLTTMANLASMYMYQGQWEEAKQLNVQVMEIRKAKLGADHPDTLTTMANLASTYMNQGLWEEAEQLNVQVMEIRKAKLGADHPSTLTSMHNLASTYSEQGGRWEEAKQLQVQVMEIRKAKLGADHPSTLTSMHNLALMYMNQGQWEKAEQLQVQVMEGRKTKFGIDHPSTLTSMNNLASTYSEQGRWEEAEQLHVQVIETRKAAQTIPTR